MTGRILSILLLSTAFPLTALAQTSQGEAGTTITNPGSAAEQSEPSAMGQTAATSGPFVTIPETGVWRVSDFEGKAVFSTEGESIGEINDVLVSQDGSVNAVVIGVGGFLGIGEKDVAIDMSALELGPGATPAEAAAVSAENPQAAPGGVSSETTASTTDNAATPPPAGTATENDTAANSEAAPGAPAMPQTGDDQQMAANDAAMGGEIAIGEDGLPERIVVNVTREQLEGAPAFEGLRGEVPKEQ